MSIESRLRAIERAVTPRKIGVHTLQEIREEKCTRCSATVPESETLLHLVGGPPRARIARCVLCGCGFLSLPGLRYLESEAERDSALAELLAAAREATAGRCFRYGDDEPTLRKYLLERWDDLYWNDRPTFDREAPIWRLRPHR